MWKGRAIYLDRAPRLEAGPLAFGALEHRAIELLVDHLIGTKQSQDAGAAESIWRDLLATTRAPDDIAGPARELFFRFAGRFTLDLERVWQPEGQLAITADRQPCEWDAPEAWLRGRPDLLYVDPSGYSAEAWDWKTSFTPEPEARFRDGLQPTTLALLLRCFLPDLAVIKVRFVYIRYNVEQVALYQPQDCERAWASWQGFHAFLTDAFARLDERRLWAPTPGSHCGTCPVSPRCPLAAQLEGLVVTDAASAKEAAARLVAMRAASAVLSDQIRAWVRQRGPLDVGDMRWDFWTPDHLDYAIHQVQRVLEKYHLDPLEYFSVNNQKLKGLRRKAAGALEELKPFGTVPAPRFDGKKPKESSPTPSPSPTPTSTKGA